MSADPSSLPAAADALLTARLADQRPKSVLLISAGGSAAEIPACLHGPALVHIPAHALPGALPVGKRFGAGVVLDGLAGLSRADGTQLLAQLRDQLCEQVFVVVTKASAWSREDMLALAYTLRARSADDQWLLYDHDIASYNPERDWNTPEHWANPENFERYRW